MMTLDIQIQSLFFSFIFGLFLAFFLNINKKIIYNNNNLIKWFGTFLVILNCFLLYFIILKKINNGIFHIYCLLVLSIGLYTYKVIAKHIKKWYTNHRKKVN